MSQEIRSKTMRLDEKAVSAQPELPAFLAPPAGSPAYHGFPLVEETRVEGWCFGAISDFLEPDAPDGCHFGDGFVEAPDGSRAGIVWATDVTGVEEILPPKGNRWGVWSVGFSRPIQTLEDLLFNFGRMLPLLQEKYRQIKVEQTAA
jgi:hypothetical protein